MKEMARMVPAGSCPKCGHSQFIVLESSIDAYLTNRDGEVMDSKNVSYACRGMCCNCHEKFEMHATPTRFIPLTPLRKLLYEYCGYERLEPPADEMRSIPNPMMKEA